MRLDELTIPQLIAIRNALMRYHPANQIENAVVQDTLKDILNALDNRKD